MTWTYRPATDDDRERIGLLRAQAFVVAPAEAVSGSIEGFRMLERDGHVAAGLRFQPVGQWFGGRSLRAAAIASVVVAPENRGDGTGSYMLRETLAELHADGFALATLYPSTLPTYRKGGFEIAGYRYHYTAPIPRLTVERAARRVEPFGNDSHDEVAECYSRAAGLGNGQLDRPAWWWRARVYASSVAAPLYRYLVRDDEGRVSGYAVHTQPQVKDAGLPYNFTVDCRDLVWLDEDAARSLLAYVTSQRALGVDLAWYGPPDDALRMFVPEPVMRTESGFEWMLRLVDVPGALESRGYPATLRASVEIAVSDPILVANDGAWTIEVADGSAKVVAGTSARARTSVATLASMFTGYLHPRDAVRTGRLQDASSDEVEALASMFAGPSPWMLDQF